MSILTGDETARSAPRARNDLATVFGRIALALEHNAANSEKLSSTLSRLELPENDGGPVDLSPESIEQIKQLMGGLAAAVIETSKQVFGLHQALASLPAPTVAVDISAITTLVGEVKTLLAEHGEQLSALASQQVNAPELRAVPATISPAQMKKVLAPVHLTVDVERRFDGRIERFIVNEA